VLDRDPACNRLLSPCSISRLSRNPDISSRACLWRSGAATSPFACNLFRAGLPDRHPSTRELDGSFSITRRARHRRDSGHRRRRTMLHGDAGRERKAGGDRTPSAARRVDRRGAQIFAISRSSLRAHRGGSVVIDNVPPHKTWLACPRGLSRRRRAEPPGDGSGPRHLSTRDLAEERRPRGGRSATVPFRTTVRLSSPCSATRDGQGNLGVAEEHSRHAATFR